MEKNDIFQVTIEDMSKDGEGIGHVDGLTVFVKDTAPGDRIRARLTKEKKYADDYAVFMEYLDDTVLDHTCGSWFHQLDEKNHLKNTVWPGKPDLYHAFQAMLIPYGPAGLSVARAVHDGRITIER